MKASANGVIYAGIFGMSGILEQISRTDMFNRFFTTAILCISLVA